MDKKEARMLVGGRAGDAVWGGLLVSCPDLGESLEAAGLSPRDRSGWPVITPTVWTLGPRRVG